MGRDVRVRKKKANKLSYIHLASENIFERVKLTCDTGNDIIVPIVCKTLLTKAVRSAHIWVRWLRVLKT
jgi:hypothetical protein